MNWLTMAVRVSDVLTNDDIVNDSQCIIYMTQNSPLEAFFFYTET